MSFGLTSIKDATVPLSLLRTVLPAAVIQRIVIQPGGNFTVLVQLPRGVVVAGAMLAWVKKDFPTHYPFAGLTMYQCLAVQNNLSLPLGGPSGTLLTYVGNVGTLIGAGDEVEFVCAATDDPDELSTP